VRTDDQIVMRGASGWWISGILVALFFFMLLDAAVRGEWSTVLVALPWMCAVLLICWGLLIRPRLIVTPIALTVVNVLRTHTLPWRDVTDLHVRYQLIVTLQDGKRIRAWGSPTVHPRHDHAVGGSSSRDRGFVSVVEAIDQARDELGRPADLTTPASTRLVWWPLIAFTVAVGLGLATAQIPY